LAFQHFVDSGVDSAVFEVGLGGRLVGTNPFNSSVCVITSIGKDHMKSLGDTLGKIAFEKAGIIKENVPVVIGALPDEAMEVVIEQAILKKAPYYVIGRDFFVENVALSVEGTCFDFKFPEYDIDLKELRLNLLGKHQAGNAGLALAAFFIYLGKEVQGSRFKVQNALRTVNWQGRLQVLSSNPLVIIDGAHNEEGVSTLVANLKEMFPRYKYHFLVAILRDKKLDKMIEEICSVAEVIYISKNQSDRAADIEEQVEVAVACGTKYFANDDIVESAKKCLKSLNSAEEMLVITGSLYTIAEILKVKDELFK